MGNIMTPIFSRTWDIRWPTVPLLIRNLFTAGLLVIFLVTSALDAAAQKAQWRRVALFSGDGRQVTAPFVITGGEWRVRWIARQTDAVGCHFAVTATGGRYDQLLVNTNKPGRETSYGKGTGRFSLEVSAVFASWDILVEELK